MTFHLRSGLKFPNGEAVDAHAVKWSLERALKNGLAGDAVFQEVQFSPALVKSISTPSSTTVTIHYSRPAPNQPAVLATPSVSIYDPALIEAHGGVKEGKDNEWVASHDAGYGPYLLKSYSPGHQLVLERNPSFFEPAKNKKVIINFVSSNETLLLDAKSGSADVTLGLSDEAVHSLTGDSCCTIVAGTSRRAEYMNVPDLGHVEVFKNSDAREALAYAVPYKAILEKIAYGYGTLFSGPWYPSYSWYSSSVGKPHEYNLTKAKELMKKSGVKTPANVTIVVADGEIVGREIAAVVANSWQQIGVNAKITTVSTSELFEIEKKYEDASIEVEGPEVVAPAYFWAYAYQCEPKNPDGVNVCSHEGDKLMTEVQDGKFVDEPSKEQEALNKVDEIYEKIPAEIWFYGSKSISVLGKDMTSYYSSDMPEVRFWEKS